MLRHHTAAHSAARLNILQTQRQLRKARALAATLHRLHKHYTQYVMQSERVYPIKTPCTYQRGESGQMCPCHSVNSAELGRAEDAELLKHPWSAAQARRARLGRICPGGASHSLYMPAPPGGVPRDSQHRMRRDTRFRTVVTVVRAQL